MKVISSTIFVCVLFFGAAVPGVTAHDTTGSITLRQIGAENTLDFQIYYGKIKM